MSDSISNRQSHLVSAFLTFCLLIGVVSTYDIEKRDIGSSLTNFEKEIRRMLYRVERIRQAKRDLDNINCLDQIPKHLMLKWVPDPSRFKGASEYFSDNQLIYNAKPHFEKLSKTETELKLVMGNYKTEGVILEEGCVYSSIDQLMKVYVENGDLFINEEYFDGEIKELVLVYSIPAEDLI